MAGRKRSSKGRDKQAGTPKTAQRKTQKPPRRRKDSTHRVTGSGWASGAERRKGDQKTVRASSRKRAAEAGTLANMQPGRAKAEKHPVIRENDPNEIYGVALSEAQRKGESVAALPQQRTKPTSAKKQRRPRP